MLVEILIDAPSDPVLTRRAQLGDRDAFETLFHRHRSAAHRLALRMLGCDDLAEEVVQESWIKVWLKLPDFEGRSAFTTWLFRIVVHQALDLQRQRQPMSVVDVYLEPLTFETHSSGAEGDPHGALITQEFWRKLAVELSSLPPRQREAWQLREFEGFSYAEIAQTLDTSESAVRGVLHRARGAVATKMERWS